MCLLRGNGPVPGLLQSVRDWKVGSWGWAGNSSGTRGLRGPAGLGLTSAHAQHLPALKVRQSPEPQAPKCSWVGGGAGSRAPPGPPGLSALAQGGPALLLSVSWLDCKFSGRGWRPVELCHVPWLQGRPSFSVTSLRTSLSPPALSCLPVHHPRPCFWPCYLPCLLPCVCVSVPLCHPLGICLTHASSLISEQAA